ncbi:MAG: hypothetical protein CMH60_05390, partial [Myxococcales bacterium]|nr:hypothetical protein [Myxococcales bacterium]
AVEDCFGVCGGHAVEDCFGVCGGNAVEDCFGICGGNAVVDCAGDCGGNAMEDCAGVCNGLTVVDCAGDCGGNAMEDCAGVCNGLTVVDCAGDCGGDAVRDCAGICNGLTVFDCNDDCGGDAVEDCFGVCDGSAYIDECGVCGGSGEIYECGCHDIPEGECDCDGNVLDCNGVCGGDGESCESASEESQCSKIEKNSNWELCDESEDSCSGVFYDSVGCGEFCASIGMVCAEVWDNLDGVCAPNLNKPRLSCSGGTGHFSDYCVCVDAQECVPSCDGRSCGDDGCGGSCGTCDSGGSCVSGKCQSLYQDSSLLDELVGYGQGTTGGLGGSLCKVTNLKNSGSGSLRACAESSGKKWIQFAVSGNIYLKSDIQVKSNKTIDGRNRKIQIYNKGLNISNQSNIIVTNLIFKKGDSGHDNDAIRIRNGSQDVWVHHCSFSNYHDGLVDIKEGSTDITVSWSKFYDHDKVMLIGASVNDTMDKHIRVTLHHNWFKETKQRHPRLRYGKVHAFNNYYDSWGDYGLGCSYKGQCFSENNVYDAGSNKKAAVYKVGSDTKDAKVSSKGDEFRNGAVFNEKNSSSVFKPSQYYHYNAENAGNNLINKIKARAGWE